MILKKNMTTQIINSIKSIMPINAAEEAAFIKILTVKQFKKKAFLLQEGQICHKISFINSGAMRVFYNVEGVENTVQFFFADSWYTDYESFSWFWEANAGYKLDFAKKQNTNLYVIAQFGILSKITADIGPRGGKSDTFPQGNLVVGINF